MNSNDQAACIIGHVTVRDSAKWDQYCARVPATLAPFGAALLLRGRRFPDAASVERWYASTAYQELIPLREVAADVTIVAFET
jgi:uncharacterized protein (DUF1330 family)